MSWMVLGFVFLKGELSYFSPPWERGGGVLWGEQGSAALARQGRAAGHEHPEQAPASIAEANEGVLSLAGHSPARELELTGSSPAEQF